MTRAIIILCLLLSCPAISQQEGESPHSGQSDSNTDKHTDINQNERLNLEPIIKSLDAIAANTAPDSDAQKRQEDREKETVDIARKDYLEQEKMARFTRAIYMVTAVGLLISVIGIVLVWQTLRATRESVRSANISAKAAEDVVKQNRAWVVQKERGRLESNMSSDGYIKLDTYWINAGKTPAVDVRIEHRMASEVLTEGENIPVFEPTGVWDVIGVMGPNIISPPGFLKITNDAFKALKSGERRVFVFTHIKYRTIYGDECFTETVEEIILIGVTPAINFAGPQQRAT